jgi:hypothetical protein
MAIDPRRGSSRPPSVYFENAFWRFLLDTKFDADERQEPRFRQFSENLRNFVVAGAVLKTGTSMTSGGIAPRVLVIMGWLATAFSAAQLFGLTLLAFHWYFGIGTGLFRPSGFRRRIRDIVDLPLAMIIPLLVVWAMYEFVTNALWAVQVH